MAAEREYDALVVGAGLGGLSVAALLARAGLSVLVAEQGNAAGGYAHGFRRGAYRFDPAVHVIPEREFLANVFGYLGVADRFVLMPTEHFYGARFPGLGYVLPSADTEAFVEEHVRHFPHEAEGLRRFWGVVEQTFQDVSFMSVRVDVKDLEDASRRFPTLFKYRTAVLADVLAEHVADPRARAACAASWPYLGSPPSQVSFLAWAMVIRTLRRGSNHCQGGFQNLVDALVESLRSSGGQLLLDTPVERILVEGGQAAGFRVAGGQEYRAPLVISNADARTTLTRMVGVEHLPAPYVKRLQRMVPSLSACVLFTATRMDLKPLGLAHETFVHKHWDHEEVYRDVLAGKPGGMWVSIPSLIDPSLAPPGESTVTLSAIAPWDVGEPWDQRKDRQTELMLDELEAFLPGFREHLTFADLATPATLERYCRNEQGATYGWATIPSQTASKRLARETPLPGLYLSGHWTDVGPGSFRAIMAGVRTAATILEKAGRGGVMPDFRPDHIPTTNSWKSSTA